MKTRIMIRGNLLQVVCPEKKAIKFVIAFYKIDGDITFLREYKKGDIAILRDSKHYEQMFNNDIFLEFDLSESSIPYMNIENIANYLLETL